MKTFKDDTSIMSPDTNSTKASKNLQNYFNLLETWINQRKIVFNTNKSTQINFTTKYNNCSQITLNNQILSKIS